MTLIQEINASLVESFFMRQSAFLSAVELAAIQTIACAIEYTKVQSERTDKHYKMSVAPWQTLNLSNAISFERNIKSADFLECLEQKFELKLQGDVEINFWQYGISDELSAHLDKEDKKISLILFLNNRWDASWGGILKLYTDFEAKLYETVTPSGNTAVFLKRTSSSWHEVSAVVEPNVIRKSLQVVFR